MKRRILPGPGLPEAIAWTIGVLFVHAIAGFAMFLLAVVLQAFSQGVSQDPQAIRHLLTEIQGKFAVLVAGGEQLLFVLATLLAVLLRLGRDARRKLGLTPIFTGHYVMVPLLVLPLSLLCGELYRQLSDIVGRLFQSAPWFEAIENLQSMEMLQILAQEMSWPTLLMVIAVAPAIGEELVFRGIIGRGLVARWGIVAGIGITSLLFAVVHLHPAHALALIPLAIFIHLLHLVTRSLWAPVLLHFLNNAWAATVTKFADHFHVHVDGIADESPVPGRLLLASLACVLCAGVLLWKSRVQFHLPNGQIWDPGYCSVDQPPSELSAVARCRPVSGWLIALTVVSFLALFATMLLAI